MRLGFGLGITFPQCPPDFSPMDLGPLVWYDAADTSTITESGGSVSQWDDKSGNGYHVAQATAASQPSTGTRTQNGLNVVDFVPNTVLESNFDITELTASKALTVVFVYKADINSSSIATVNFGRTGVWSLGSGYSMTHTPVATNEIRHFVGIGNGLATSPSFATSIPSSLTLDPTMAAMRVEASSATLFGYIDDQAGSGPSAFGTMDPADFLSANSGNHQTMLGARRDLNGAVGNYLDGFIAEVLAYDYLATTDELVLLQSYLNDKWNIF